MAIVFTPGEAVKINIQSPDPHSPNRAFRGAIEDIRDKQLLLLSDEEVGNPAQLSARTSHLLYLGCVEKSQLRADGKWNLTVAVYRTLAMM